MQTLTRSAVSAGSAHPHPLTPAEVEASRRRGGSNRLTQKPRRGFWRRFLANLGDPVIRILLCALGLNLLFAFRGADWFETGGIALAVFLATLISTLSEHGSEAAYARLSEVCARTVCRVRRADGSLRDSEAGNPRQRELLRTTRESISARRQELPSSRLQRVRS